MKFKRRLQTEQGLRQISIIPLVNIVLLLLVFFVLASGFVVSEGLKVNLPKAVTGELIKYKNIEVVVSADGIIYLDKRVIEPEELKIQLEYVSKRREAAVLIKADKGVSLGRIVQIWDFCRKSGITQISIATN